MTRVQLRQSRPLTLRLSIGLLGPGAGWFYLVGH